MSARQCEVFGCKSQEHSASGFCQKHELDHPISIMIDTSNLPVSKLQQNTGPSEEPSKEPTKETSTQTKSKADKKPIAPIYLPNPNPTEPSILLLLGGMLIPPAGLFLAISIAIESGSAAVCLVILPGSILLSYVLVSSYWKAKKLYKKVNKENFDIEQYDTFIEAEQNRVKETEQGLIIFFAFTMVLGILAMIFSSIYLFCFTVLCLCVMIVIIINEVFK